MKPSLFKYIIPAAITALFIMSACTPHGNLSLSNPYETEALMTGILSQTDQYTVHFHGNSEKLVSGILFDPKDDEKRIHPEGMYWKAVVESETIAAIVRTIKKSDHPGYYPRLYEISDPQGVFYGYLYTGWSYLAIRPLNENSLRVFGLKGPPEYEDVYSGGR